MAGLAAGSTRSQMSEQGATRVRSSLDKAYFVARCLVGVTPVGRGRRDRERQPRVPAQRTIGRVHFVILRLTGGGGAAAGEMTNVSQVFQPAGRAELPNSP